MDVLIGWEWLCYGVKRPSLCVLCSECNCDFVVATEEYFTFLRAARLSPPQVLATTPLTKGEIKEIIFSRSLVHVAVALVLRSLSATLCAAVLALPVAHFVLFVRTDGLQSGARY